MIFGIGTDICDISRIKKTLSNQGERFVKRILTPMEQNAFNELKFNKESFLAKRFSMKEAVAKALGTGIGENLSFQDIEIRKEEGGAPYVHLFPVKYSDMYVHLSVSDEEQYAVAFAVAERRGMAR